MFGNWNDTYIEFAPQHRISKSKAVRYIICFFIFLIVSFTLIVSFREIGAFISIIIGVGLVITLQLLEFWEGIP